ncbi:hypothetical protein F751_6631 [Auxenochlorella protothecoides]|uniref:Uncharacterized protein n=1 Tax=Auxenochlorella protothecoides TaxID=3075 RepID=A0A087SLS0_AUXPR|nr:hypothetical protein F751_6631 [Auxenochlorella protothecoides]KFM26674.1 hypothetical protein F751_6631 [Auxenochlorella protothecoides]
MFSRCLYGTLHGVFPGHLDLVQAPPEGGDQQAAAKGAGRRVTAGLHMHFVLSH